jgi:hypothetical protein
MYQDVFVFEEQPTDDSPDLEHQFRYELPVCIILSLAPFISCTLVAKAPVHIGFEPNLVARVECALLQRC